MPAHPGDDERCTADGLAPVDVVVTGEHQRHPLRDGKIRERLRVRSRGAVRSGRVVRFVHREDRPVPGRLRGTDLVPHPRPPRGSGRVPVRGFLWARGDDACAGDSDDLLDPGLTFGTGGGRHAHLVGGRVVAGCRVAGHGVRVAVLVVALHPPDGAGDAGLHRVAEALRGRAVGEVAEQQRQGRVGLPHRGEVRTPRVLQTDITDGDDRRLHRVDDHGRPVLVGEPHPHRFETQALPGRAAHGTPGDLGQPPQVLHVRLTVRRDRRERRPDPYRFHPQGPARRADLAGRLRTPSEVLHVSLHDQGRVDVVDPQRLHAQRLPGRADGRHTRLVGLHAGVGPADVLHVPGQPRRRRVGGSAKHREHGSEREDDPEDAGSHDGAFQPATSASTVRVFEPGIPSGFSFWSVWNSTTRAVVLSPRSPSTTSGGRSG